MPTFQDRENNPPMLEQGDYQWECISHDKKISVGAKTKGSDQHELKFRVGPGNILYESFTEHETTDWRMDVFVKCAGVKLIMNQPYTFGFPNGENDQAGRNLVDPVGLRGWCHVVIDEYKPEGATQMKKRNKIALFYTDKEKIPRNENVAPREASPF